MLIYPAGEFAAVLVGWLLHLLLLLQNAWCCAMVKHDTLHVFDMLLSIGLTVCCRLADADVVKMARKADSTVCGADLAK